MPTQTVEERRKFLNQTGSNLPIRSFELNPRGIKPVDTIEMLPKTIGGLNRVNPVARPEVSQEASPQTLNQLPQGPDVFARFGGVEAENLLPRSQKLAREMTHTTSAGQRDPSLESGLQHQQWLRDQAKRTGTSTLAPTVPSIPNSSSTERLVNPNEQALPAQPIREAGVPIPEGGVYNQAFLDANPEYKASLPKGSGDFASNNFSTFNVEGMVDNLKLDKFRKYTAAGYNAEAAHRLAGFKGDSTGTEVPDYPDLRPKSRAKMQNEFRRTTMQGDIARRSQEGQTERARLVKPVGAKAQSFGDQFKQAKAKRDFFQDFGANNKLLDNLVAEYSSSLGMSLDEINNIMQELIEQQSSGQADFDLAANQDTIKTAFIRRMGQ